ncbi:MAG: prolyl aminopeptidase [Phycisphaerae bacterium]|nr:prolyl aminopeptidase [Phycisphaerae bacterium]
MSPLRKLFLFSFVVVTFASSARGDETPGESGLFDAAPPFKTGHLQVDDVHQIYYALFGNPDGMPVIVLHGGPGSGCYPRLMQYFDPRKWLIVLHDQRGAGQSRPVGEVRANTTQHLVADVEKLRAHLGIEKKALVFGGSWGSTLALAYAETHPESVRGLVLRGVFTASDDEPLNGFVGPMPRAFFPDAAAEFDAALPDNLKPCTPQKLLDLFSGKDAATQRRVAAAWIRCAIKTGELHAPDEKVNAGWGDFDAVPGARIDCHYAVNGFFLNGDQLLRDADKLKGIPTIIINGRYDVICPPTTAWRLHRQLPQSKLIIVEEAGHFESEPGTTQALLTAVREFE